VALALRDLNGARAPLEVTQSRVPPDMKTQLDLFDAAGRFPGAVILGLDPRIGPSACTTSDRSSATAARSSGQARG